MTACSWDVGRLALYTAFACVARPLVAQDSSPSRWVVAAGPGYVFRSMDVSGSLGAHVRVGRVIRVASSLNLEPGVTWHGYLGSDAFTPGDTCVDECPTVDDGISILGLELGVTYRESDAENRIYPILSVGFYNSTVHDTSKTRAGASVGVVVPFRRSGRGPALDLRYFHMFSDSRFSGLIPVSLRWTF